MDVITDPRQIEDIKEFRRKVRIFTPEEEERHREWRLQRDAQDKASREPSKPASEPESTTTPR
jgi:hypothetical protein